MAELKGSMFASLLPCSLAGQAEVRAIAYAISRQLDKVLAYSDAAQILCSIDSMPDEVLDYLASEWRTPSYDESFALDVKRQLIKDTLLIYIQMGTPAAVQRIIKAIFGTGEVKEWFDYDGEVHYFRVTTGNSEVDNARAAELVKALNDVKRLSSWLENIITEITSPTIEARVNVTCASELEISETSLPQRTFTVTALSTSVYKAINNGLAISETRLPELEQPDVELSTSLYMGVAEGASFTETYLPQRS